MGQLGSGRELGAAARSVLLALRSVPAKTEPVVDAVLGWVAFESRRFRPAFAEPQPQLRLRAIDVALVALAVAPVAVLLPSESLAGAPEARQPRGAHPVQADVDVVAVCGGRVHAAARLAPPGEAGRVARPAPAHPTTTRGSPR